MMLSHAAVLQKFSLNEADMLGQGGEGIVYALDEQRVLKICKAEAKIERLERKKDFYALLQGKDVAFDVPQVIEVASLGDVSYTIEKRIPGKSLTEVLKTADGSQRQALWESYVNMVGNIRHISYNAPYFGEILAQTPLRTAEWPEFLISRASQELHVSASVLSTDVPELDKKLYEWQQRVRSQLKVVQASLVHGDFCPDNTMAANDRLTAVIDFGGLTLVGDWRLDIAGSLVFLDLMSTVTQDDIHHVSNLIAERYPEVMEVLDTYRVYYSLRFSDAYDYDHKLYAWCVANLKEFK